MAKTGGRDFKKGWKGGPGRPKTPEEIKRVRTLSAAEVAEVGTMLLDGHISELEALSKDPKASLLKTWTAALIIKSINKGDSVIYKNVMDRIIGKPKEHITLVGKLKISTDRKYLQEPTLRNAALLLAERIADEEVVDAKPEGDPND